MPDFPSGPRAISGNRIAAAAAFFVFGIPATVQHHHFSPIKKDAATGLQIDADPFIDVLNRRGITPFTPPKANRKVQRDCDFALYCERNLVERFLNKLKHFRAIATR